MNLTDIGTGTPKNDRRAEKRSVMCHICGAFCANVSSLKKHINIHSGDVPFLCEVCGRKFAQSSSLYRHMSIHQDTISSNKCEICKKLFRQKNHLSLHVLNYHKRNKIHRRRIKHKMDDSFDEKLPQLSKCTVNEKTNPGISDLIKTYIFSIDSVIEKFEQIEGCINNLEIYLKLKSQLYSAQPYNVPEEERLCNELRYSMTEANTLKVVQDDVPSVCHFNDTQEINATEAYLKRDSERDVSSKIDAFNDAQTHNSTDTTSLSVLHKGSSFIRAFSPSSPTFLHSSPIPFMVNDLSPLTITSTPINSTAGYTRLNTKTKLIKSQKLKEYNRKILNSETLKDTTQKNESQNKTVDIQSPEAQRCTTKRDLHETLEPKSKISKNKNPQQKAPKKIRCDVCDKKVRSDYLVKHTRIHTSFRPHMCHICTDSFNTSQDLIKHIRIHTKEKPFQCDKCGRKFAHSHSLTRHKRIHTHERPYVCTTCGKGFRQMSDLTRHFKCHKFMQCFVYVCEICKFKCKHKHSLKRHMCIHTMIRPYKCADCEFQSTQKSDVVRHIRKCHINQHLCKRKCSHVYRTKARSEYLNDSPNSSKIKREVGIVNINTLDTSISSDNNRRKQIEFDVNPHINDGQSLLIKSPTPSVLCHQSNSNSSLINRSLFAEEQRSLDVSGDPTAPSVSSLLPFTTIYKKVPCSSINIRQCDVVLLDMTI